MATVRRARGLERVLDHLAAPAGADERGRLELRGQPQRAPRGGQRLRRLLRAQPRGLRGQALGFLDR